MNILSSFLVAVGLSMDNMAVTILAGCACRVKECRHFLWGISSLFALAHWGMFSLGFEGGMLVHAGRKTGAWIACVILLIIGGKMIQNAFRPAAITQNLFSSVQMQVALAVATSLDALFVGAGMGLAHSPFWLTVTIMVGCVFVTSFSGFYVGHFLGQKFGAKMEIIGGGVLMLLGIKVLLDGMGIL